MTPEEAKPHGLMFVTEMQMVDGKLCGPVHMGFTAKETAEIARSYAQAVENQRHDPCSATSELCDRWRDLFKEWSK